MTWIGSGVRCRDPYAGAIFIKIGQTVIAGIVKWTRLFYDASDNGPMNERPRLYTSVLQDHLERHRQMAFVSGPRQVGKTTVCRSLSNSYLNWDNSDDRRSVLRGPASLAESLQLNRLRGKPPVAVLDELHKYSNWKALLKGFFGTFGIAKIDCTGKILDAAINFSRL